MINQQIVRFLHKIFGRKKPLVAPNRNDYISSDASIASDLLEIFRRDEALVIFDIGACEGEDSIRYSRLFPNSRIFAFEPVPENVAMIERNVTAYGQTNIEIVRCALSDVEGTATFHVSSGAPDGASNTDDWNYGNKSSSLLAPGEVLKHHPWLQFDRTIEVKTQTLDGFCRERGLAAVDYIHMDVQGAELRVLRGATALLPSLRAVWTEVERVALYQNQPLADEIEQYMAAHGMEKVLDTSNSVSGDHLYVRR